MNQTLTAGARARDCWIPLTTLGCLLAVNCCAAGRNLRSRSTAEVGDAVALELIDELEVDADGGSRHRHRRQTVVHTPLAAATMTELRLCHRGAATLDDLQGSTERGSNRTPAVTAPLPGTGCAGAATTALRFGAVQPGATVELTWAETTPAAPRPWSRVVPLALWHPITTRRINVRLPPGTPLYWECLGCPSPPHVEANPAAGDYRFTWAALPAVHLEDRRMLRLSSGAGQPRLVLSTTDSWTQLCEPVLSSFRAAAALSEAVQRKAESLAELAPTRSLAITAARRFVAAFAPAAAVDDWQPRTAEQILTDGPRHALDQAVLLSALLGALAVPTRPVLVAGDPVFTREVVALDQFTGVWLATAAGPAEAWLDPRTLRSGGLALLAGRELLDLETGIFESPPATLPQSVSSLDGVLTVRRDGSVRAQLDLVLAGAYSPFFAPALDSAAQLAALLPAPAAAPWRLDCEGCTWRWRELSAEQSVVTLVTESRAVAVGRYWAVHLPLPALSQLRDPRLVEATCLTPVELNAAARERWSIRVELAAELDLVSQAPAAVLTNNAGQLTVTSRMIGTTLTLGGELTLPNRVLDRDACLSAHDLRRELGRTNNQLLLLERRPPLADSSLR